MGVTISNLFVTPPAAAGGTGSVTLTIGGVTGITALTLLEQSAPTVPVQQSNPVAPATVTVTGILPGAYTVAVGHAGPPSSTLATQNFTIPAYVAPVPGCTDPSADNYNPSATQDDGSCAYTPAARTPHFAVPLGQSLRFVLPGRPDLAAVDNALLATSAPTGDTNPGYCQLVERGDTLVLQYQSNYTGVATVTLQPATGAALSFVPARVVQGAGQSALFEAYARPATLAANTRIYFNNDALPLPLLPGGRVTLAGVVGLTGTYPIADVREDPAAAVPFLLLSTPYPGGAQRLDVTLTTPYALQVFDTYQVVLPFAAVPAGSWQCIITVTDPDFGTDTAESEPIDVAALHRDTLVVAYRNFDNAFELNYTAGLVNRLRLKARLFERQTATQKTTLRGSDNRLTLLTADAQRKLPLTVYLAPGWLHEVIALALCHDFVRVDGLEVVLEGEYEYGATTRYTLSTGTALLEQANFLQGNRDDVGDTDKGTLLLANDTFLTVNP